MRASGMFYLFTIMMASSCGSMEISGTSVAFEQAISVVETETFDGTLRNTRIEVTDWSRDCGVMERYYAELNAALALVEQGDVLAGQQRYEAAHVGIPYERTTLTIEMYSAMTEKRDGMYSILGDTVDGLVIPQHLDAICAVNHLVDPGQIVDYSDESATQESIRCAAGALDATERASSTGLVVSGNLVFSDSALDPEISLFRVDAPQCEQL